MSENPITVNGVGHELTADSRWELTHTLHDDLTYTGPNIARETSIYDACTVNVDGDAAKSRAVLSVRGDGAEITSIEGLTGETPHPVQNSLRVNMRSSVGTGHRK